MVFEVDIVLLLEDNDAAGMAKQGAPLHYLVPLPRSHVLADVCT